MTKFDEVLLQVINDKQSGSVAILQQLIRAILGYLIREEGNVKDREVIRKRLPLMRGSLGHFEVVSHFLKGLEDMLKSIEQNSKTADELFDYVKDYDQRWKTANVQVADLALKNLDFNHKTIFLHSNSSVISSLFRKIAGEQIVCKIIQTESRPENEGRYQAEKLTALGFEVKFVVDAAAAFMMGEADMMLTGADQIHPDYFVNKIGTYMMALVCREKNIPVYVLADSRKISSRKTSPESLYNIIKPGEDIWKNYPKNLEPVNFYFEAIPTNLVTAFITESNVMNPQDLKLKRQ
jgi:translation initiation factor 2B subunit (eIF-2B alpha/beta/delta family)